MSDEQASTLGSDARETMRRVPTASNPPSPIDADAALLDRLIAPIVAAADTLEVGETLATGGMGVLKRARQRSMGREVVVKFLRDVSASRSSYLSLLREAWAAGLLEHPNIVPIHTVALADDGAPVIVMKRIEGISWQEVLEDPGAHEELIDADDPLDWHLQVLVQVCNALRYAHSRGVVHLDIKPDNVMIGSFGEVYLVDWGIAATVADDHGGRLLRAGSRERPLGTPAYMAPEMVDAEGVSLSEATDTYLLGATLYQVLTGEPPHLAAGIVKSIMSARRCEPPTFGADVPDELAEICRRALRREPEHRFRDVGEFREAIVEFGRHRESVKLSTASRARLEKIRDLSRDSAGPGEAELHAIFGECRFGFEQALRLWPDNEQAQGGLQRALVLMANHHLDAERVGAASLLIDELLEPQPELVARRDALEERIEEREREMQRLEEMRHEADVNVGRHNRSIFALVLGVLWGGITLARALSAGGGAPGESHGGYLFEVGVVLIIVLGAVFVGGRSLLQNAANRKMISAIPLMVVGGLGLRILGTLDGVAVETLSNLETFIYGVGGAILAVSLDLRILWAVIPYLVGSLVGAQLDQGTYYVYAATNFCSMSLLAWAWWPSPE